MEPYVRTLQFEVDSSGLIVRVHRHGSAPCGAASFVGVPLAGAVKPVGISPGPMYHGVLGGHWPCQYAFAPGQHYYTVDVYLQTQNRTRAPKGCFATYGRTAEIAERFDSLACEVLVAVPAPISPETQPPGTTELCMAQEFLHDRLAHPLSVITLSGTTVVAVLPCMERRVLEAKFASFAGDCRTALSDRYSWAAGVQTEKSPFDLRRVVAESIARCRAAENPDKAA